SPRPSPAALPAPDSFPPRRSSDLGLWPQHVIPGAGKGGRDRVVADFWRNDPTHSAAHLVVDTDGSVACLADLARDAAYHATVGGDRKSTRLNSSHVKTSYAVLCLK